MKEIEPKLLQAGLAARILGIGLPLLERLADQGAIRSVQVGPQRMFRPEDLEAFVAGLPPWPILPAEPDGASDEPPSWDDMSILQPEAALGPAAKEVA
jgi:excisionase family DNA binding protein